MFKLLYFIAAFELVLYGCMVANRRWLFYTSYQRTYTRGDYAMPPQSTAGAGAASANRDEDDDDYEFDYSSLIMSDQI